MSKSKMLPWIIWGIASLFYLYEIMLRGSPSVMTRDLMMHYKIDAAQLGLLTSAYYYSYTLLQIPCGMIIDMFGARLILTLSALLSALAMYLFAQGTCFTTAIIARFLLGAGSACVFIGCLKIASEWFAKKQFSKICGLTNMMGTLGGLCSGYPVALSAKFLGWQQTCLYMAVLGACTSIVIFCVVRNKEKIAHAQEERVSVRGLKQILCSRNMWLIAIFNGIMYIPITAFTELWAVPFLKSAYAISTEKASSISTIVFLGSAIGSSFWPKIADWFDSYITVMKIACVATIMLFILILLTPPIVAMFLVMLATGIAISGKILSFACVHSFCHSKEVGMGLGFTNAITMLSGLIFQPLMGLVMNIFWTGELSAEGVRLYTTSAYVYAIAIIPLCLCFALCLLFCVKAESGACRQ